MKTRVSSSRVERKFRCLAALATFLLCMPGGFAQETHPSQEGSTPSTSQEKPASKDQKVQKDQSSSEPATAKIRITVTDPNDKPVPNASVYVRFNVSGGMFHKDHLSELSFKTNQEGSLKVPEVPQGKVLIQVIAKGWHTYGKWYDVDKDEQSVTIKLEQPPHWY
jgi:hypothetical protein